VDSGGNDDTVVRGGVGYLYSPHLPATVRQITGEPYVSFRQIWNRTEAASRGLKWPNYNDPLREIVIAEGAGRKSIFSVINPDLPAPHTIQSMLSVQRALGRSWQWRSIHPHKWDGLSAAEAVCAGHRSPNRSAAQSIFRRAGRALRDSNQTMEHNGLQTSFKKRFSNHYSFDINYTFGKDGHTGRRPAAYYIASIGNTQDSGIPSSTEDRPRTMFVTV
jgi:hypothetical protein